MVVLSAHNAPKKDVHGVRVFGCRYIVFKIIALMQTTGGSYALVQY